MPSNLTPGYPAIIPPLVPLVGAGSGGAYLAPVTGVEGAASGKVTITGVPAIGKTVTVTINGHAVVYTLVSGDTTNTLVATHFAAAINADSTSNLIVSASGSGAVVSITALVSGAPGQYSLTASATGFASGTLTEGGTPASGNTVVATINGHDVTYTLDGTDTTTALVATHVAAAINADGTDAAIVHAAAASSVVTITSLAQGASGQFTLATSVTGGGVTSAASTVTGGVTATASDSELDLAGGLYVGLTTFAYNHRSGSKTYYKGVPYQLTPTDVTALRALGYIA